MAKGGRGGRRSGASIAQSNTPAQKTGAGANITPINYTAFDERNCFAAANELDKSVSTYFNNLSLYKDTIIDNKKKLNSFWLENNISKWESVLNGK